MDYQVVVGEETYEHGIDWLLSLVEKHLRPGETLAEYIARTDEELRKQIKAELTAEIIKFWTIVSRPVDKAQLVFYVNEFDGYPPERMRDAVAHLLRTRKYTNLPTVAEIYAALKATGRK